jgi:hypothetical protein
MGVARNVGRVIGVLAPTMQAIVAAVVPAQLVVADR